MRGTQNGFPLKPGWTRGPGGELALYFQTRLTAPDILHPLRVLGNLIGIDAETGEPTWRVYRICSDPYRGSIGTEVAFDDAGLVTAEAPEDELYELPKLAYYGLPAGELRWDRALFGTDVYYVWLLDTLLVTAETESMPSRALVRCADRRSGTERWLVESESILRPVAQAGDLLVFQADDWVEARRIQDGALAWSRPEGDPEAAAETVRATGFRLHEGKLLLEAREMRLQDRTGRLVCLDAHEGTEVAAPVARLAGRLRQPAFRYHPQEPVELFAPEHGLAPAVGLLQPESGSTVFPWTDVLWLRPYFDVIPLTDGVLALVRDHDAGLFWLVKLVTQGG
jgi:hypothetical protein